MPRARKYPVELLDRATRLVFDSGRPIAQVAADLGLPSETLRRYVRQVEADEGRRPDLPSARPCDADRTRPHSSLGDQPPISRVHNVCG
jgi:transposase-like protein